jgi:hypothetical protein
MPDMPQDPVGGLLGTANVLHELYTTMMAAGFTDVQAMYIVGKYVEAVLFRA